MNLSTSPPHLGSASSTVKRNSSTDTHCLVVYCHANVVPTELQTLSNRGVLGIRRQIQTLEKENEMNSLMVSMIAFVAGVKDRFSSEKGATAVEYGIMVALIAVVIIGAVTAFGTTSSHLFTSVATEIGTPAP